MKNVRNNLLNKKKFLFPEFVYDDNLILKSVVQQAIFTRVIYMTFMARTRK